MGSDRLAVWFRSGLGIPGNLDDSFAEGFRSANAVLIYLRFGERFASYMNLRDT